jgi:hypothetical protein
MGDILRTESGAGYSITPGDRNEGYPGSYQARIWQEGAEPTTETREFGMFAGLVVELGGYCDVELIDPYTGGRFWYQPANARQHAEASGGFDFLTVLIEASALAKVVGWLAEPTE